MKIQHAIGLMSGTSVDGIDAVLVEISGHGTHTSVKEKAFISVPYEEQIRTRLLTLAQGKEGGSEELCKVNFLLGTLCAEACEALCNHAKIPLSNIDFVGSHGHTFYHIPQKMAYMGRTFSSTLQLGEASVIAEKMNCPVVSDFRVRDVAAGGQGAPLVPYTEFLLYSDKERNIALQNIGGIGNVTIIPKGGSLDSVLAFDTGPGNMIIDALVFRYTNGKQFYDAKGAIAASGSTHHSLLNFLLEDEYYSKMPPKTTGREMYNDAFIENLLNKAASLNVSFPDIICTTTAFTAKTISLAIKDHAPCPIDRLIIGGGGSKNATLVQFLKESLPECEVLINEDIGLNSDSKEAIAFAILANETLNGNANNALGATGASHRVVMGKVSF